MPLMAAAPNEGSDGFLGDNLVLICCLAAAAVAIAAIISFQIYRRKS